MQIVATGIEDRVVQWSKHERRALEDAADILARAREAIGPETEPGMELGQGETVLRSWLGGAIIGT